jgi:hypothetical protein
MGVVDDSLHNMDGGRQFKFKMVAACLLEWISCSRQWAGARWQPTAAAWFSLLMAIKGMLGLSPRQEL